jgi:hypothetical protein
VRTVEFLLAIGLAAMGVRSLVYWLRRPFDSTDPVDHLLFAAFVVGRAGLWFAFAGELLLSLTLRNPDPRGNGAYLAGRAFADEFRLRFWWYPLVILGFLILQFLAGFFLGRRSAR